MFESSWTILRVRGIPVRLHVSLILFLPYVVLATAMQWKAVATSVGVSPEAMRLPPVVWGGILAIGLFVSILLHELAHSLVALRAGGSIRSITLMMLGGISQIDREVLPEREAWMAFAGPLASLSIAVLGFLAYRLVPLTAGPRIALFLFATTNGILAVFNLLPAFPMDGGRVLRGLLSRRLGHVRATRIATGLGRALAIVLAILGLAGFNLLLVLIAAFVFMGATAERMRVDGPLRAARGLGGRAAPPVTGGQPMLSSEIMKRSVECLSPNQTVEEAARRMREANVGFLPICDDEMHVLGTVTDRDIAIRIVAEDRPHDTRVSEAMSRDIVACRADDDVRVAEQLMGENRKSRILCIDESGHLVGVISLSDIAQYEEASLVAKTMREVTWREARPS